MIAFVCSRRFALSSIGIASLGSFLRPSSAGAQALTQPAERTKAGYLARARELRDQARREGDQAYGAVVVRAGTIVGEGRNFVVLQTDPTAHAELLAVRDAARRLKTADLSDCEVYSTATPCPMCQGALYWARVRRYHNATTPPEGVAPRLSC
jgi:tRNA(Arg) A34 adenosine deaminase TadA